MAAVKVKEPPVNYSSKGAIACKGLLINPALQIWFFDIPQAPTSGTSGDGAGWAGKGSLLIDTNAGVLYINTNTTASPTWTKVGTQS